MLLQHNRIVTIVHEWYRQLVTRSLAGTALAGSFVGNLLPQLICSRQLSSPDVYRAYVLREQDKMVCRALTCHDVMLTPSHCSNDSLTLARNN